MMALTGIASILISFGLLFNTEFGPRLFPAKYTILLGYIFVFFVHLVAYNTNKKRLVAFAVWLVLAILLYSILSWVLKWQTFNARHLIGITIGFIAALVALRSSYHKDKKNMNHEARIGRHNL